MELKNGQRVASEYAGRVHVTRSKDDSPRISLYHVWAVCIAVPAVSESSNHLFQDMSAFVKALSQ